MSRRPWVLAQTWEQVLFAHWEADPLAVRELVPRELELDTWEGRAWVTLAAFVMTGVHPRLIPPLPGTARFLETNVRTYVRRDGRPGVHFFSLDATSLPAVLAARRLVRLPYRFVRGRFRVDGPTRRYALRGAEPASAGVGLRLLYRPLGGSRLAVDGPLERFLLERYCLYVVHRPGIVRRTDIEHPPWRIRDARGLLGHERLIPDGVGAAGDPILHFADRQVVRTWSPTAA